MAPLPRRPTITKTRETRRGSGEEKRERCFVYSEPHQNDFAAFTAKKKKDDDDDDDATPPVGNNFELFSFVPNAGR